MKHILLLGAGFSRNWGGWLASEAFEYLLGCSELTDQHRQLLWRYRANGFESALAELQVDAKSKGRKGQELKVFEAAILRMFRDMDAGFEGNDFDFVGRRGDQSVGVFLNRFDAIFTLNQDLFLERAYLSSRIFEFNETWAGWQMPGMVRREAYINEQASSHSGKWFVQSDASIQLKHKHQPYIKLHGSSNWYTSDSEELLVMGANKRSTILQHSILSWNFNHFIDCLKDDVRLMVIGYSFGDSHINDAICSAAERRRLRIFVIDPLGVDVIDQNRNSKLAIYKIDKTADVLWPCVTGASRRTLGEIFGRDRIEFSKVMRFFQN